MNTIQHIIYDLLIEKDDEFEFDLSEMLENVEDCNDVIVKIVTSINRGGLEVIRDYIKVDGDKVYWNVKIKR